MSGTNRFILLVSGSVTLFLLGRLTTHCLHREPTLPETCEKSFQLPDASLLTPIDIDTGEVDPLKKASRLPKAFVIGYRDCETHTARKILELHPDIRFIPTETTYWISGRQRFTKYYKSLPRSTEKEIIMDEVSNSMNSRRAIFRMRRILPKVKLILVVRNPVLSWLSSFEEFPSSRPVNATKMNSQQLMLNCVKFVEHKYEKYIPYISFILRVFPEDHVLIVDIETLKQDPQGFMTEVEDFLELPLRFPRNLLVRRNSDKNLKVYLNKSHEIFPGLAKKLLLPADSSYFKEDRVTKFPRLTTFRVLENVHNHGKASLFEIIGKRFDWDLSKLVML